MLTGDSPPLKAMPGTEAGGRLSESKNQCQEVLGQSREHDARESEDLRKEFEDWHDHRA
jgi:hypothetical protein